MVTTLIRDENGDEVLNTSTLPLSATFNFFTDPTAGRHYLSAESGLRSGRTSTLQREQEEARRKAEKSDFTFTLLQIINDFDDGVDSFIRDAGKFAAINEQLDGLQAKQLKIIKQHGSDEQIERAEEAQRRCGHHGERTKEQLEEVKRLTLEDEREKAELSAAIKASAEAKTPEAIASAAANIQREELEGQEVRRNLARAMNGFQEHAEHLIEARRDFIDVMKEVKEIAPADIRQMSELINEQERLLKNTGNDSAATLKRLMEIENKLQIATQNTLANTALNPEQKEELEILANRSNKETRELVEGYVDEKNIHITANRESLEEFQDHYAQKLTEAQRLENEGKKIESGLIYLETLAKQTANTTPSSEIPLIGSLSKRGADAGEAIGNLFNGGQSSLNSDRYTRTEDGHIVFVNKEGDYAYVENGQQKILDPLASIDIIKQMADGKIIGNNGPVVDMTSLGTALGYSSGDGFKQSINLTSETEELLARIKEQQIALNQELSENEATIAALRTEMTALEQKIEEDQGQISLLEQFANGFNHLKNLVVSPAAAPLVSVVSPALGAGLTAFHALEECYDCYADTLDGGSALTSTPANNEGEKPNLAATNEPDPDFIAKGFKLGGPV
jgi:hypothetical protein